MALALRLLEPGVTFADTGSPTDDGVIEVVDCPTDAEADNLFLNRLGASFLLRNLAALDGTEAETQLRLNTLLDMSWSFSYDLRLTRCR